jgi:hypothetical protein
MAVGAWENPDALFVSLQYPSKTVRLSRRVMCASSTMDGGATSDILYKIY